MPHKVVFLCPKKKGKGKKERKALSNTNLPHPLTKKEAQQKGFIK